EYFFQTSLETLNDTTPSLVTGKGFVPDTVSVKSPDGLITYVEDIDWVDDDTAGTVARTPASTIPNNSQVLVRFLANPITRLGAPHALDVLNSARPAAPKVLYILPTFAWSQTHDSGGIHSTRAGGTLRVYLERPWWSSGEDEELGVLTWHGPVRRDQPLPSGKLTPYIRRIGNGPAHT